MEVLQTLRTYRGTIEIPNLDDLEEVACECYRVVRDHLASLSEYDDGLEA